MLSTALGYTFPRDLSHTTSIHNCVPVTLTHPMFILRTTEDRPFHASQNAVFFLHVVRDGFSGLLYDIIDTDWQDMSHMHNHEPQSQMCVLSCAK